MKNEILEKVLNAQKNLIVEGNMGAGKTTNVLFPIVERAIANKESLFILDSREEYLNNYYEDLKEKDYNIIILNLRDMDKSEGWNPLEYPYDLFKNGDKDRAQEYLEKIGKTMFYESSSQDPFWASTATDFFTGVTLGLFEDGTKEEVNLNSVNSMVNSVDKKYGASNYVTEYFKAKGESSNPYIFASTTILAPSETKGGILSVARQKLRLYSSREKLSQLMNKTTFNFESIVNKPTAIILIARDDNKSLNTLSAMFIEQLYAILVDLKYKNRFNLILDNFDIIEKCHDLTDILGSCMSRNIKTYIATRSLSELTNIYGNYASKICDLISIKSNSVQLIFNDVEQKIDKDFESVSIKSGKVEYPKLKVNDIKLFDLEKKVRDSKTQMLGKNYSNLDDFDADEAIKRLEEKFATIKTDKDYDIDELLKRIDDKMSKIESKDVKEEKEIKSELSQFKIEE